MNWYKAGHREKDTKDSTASFTHNRTRENIKSGEKHSTIFGKIARYFADLKLVAFTGSYDDLNGKPSSFPPASHTHTKSQVLDFAHKHGKADITDFPTSMPASDVSAWAKAANKPSYSWSDITGKPTSMPASDVSAWAKAANKPSYNWSEINNKPNELTLNQINNGPYTDYNGNIIRGKIEFTSEGIVFKSNNNDIIKINFVSSPGWSGGIFPAGPNICSIGSINSYYLLGCFSSEYVSNIYSLMDQTVSIKGNPSKYRSRITMNGTDIQFFIGNMHIAKIAYLIDGTTSLSGIIPGNDNTYLLGNPSYRWKDVYCNNATIQTSDKNNKTRISYIGQDSEFDDTYMSDDCVYEFVMGLLACIYNRVDADSGRPHHGFIAQDVKQLMNELGINDHAAFIKSPKYINVEYEEEETYVDETDGQTKTRTVTKTKPELVPGEYVQGLRYEEFIPDITRVIQIQDKKIKEQDEKIKDLEERLSTLENMVKAS